MTDHWLTASLTTIGSRLHKSCGKDRSEQDLYQSQPCVSVSRPLRLALLTLYPYKSMIFTIFCGFIDHLRCIDDIIIRDSWRASLRNVQYHAEGVMCSRHVSPVSLNSLNMRDAGFVLQLLFDEYCFVPSETQLRSPICCQ